MENTNYYVPRDYVVQAIRFKTVPETEEFLGHPIFDLIKEKSEIDNTTNTYFVLQTLEGKRRVTEGDYIVKYPNGDLHVFSPASFKEYYVKRLPGVRG